METEKDHVQRIRDELSMILLKYVGIKRKEVYPSDILKKSTEAGIPYVHPPLTERIKKLEEFEKFYYHSIQRKRHE